MSLIRRLIARLLELLGLAHHDDGTLAAPKPPVFLLPTIEGTAMSKVTIPVTPASQRVDSSALTPAEIASIDAKFSLDGGTTFSTPIKLKVGDPIVVDGVDPGSSLVVSATETDTQKTPKTSSAATITVPVPALAAPKPPTFGTPVIS